MPPFGRQQGQVAVMMRCIVSLCRMTCNLEVNAESMKVVYFKFCEPLQCNISNEARMIVDVLVWWLYMLTTSTDARYSEVPRNEFSKDRRSR